MSLEAGIIIAIITLVGNIIISSFQINLWKSQAKAKDSEAKAKDSEAASLLIKSAMEMNKQEIENYVSSNQFITRELEIIKSKYIALEQDRDALSVITIRQEAEIENLNHEYASLLAKHEALEKKYTICCARLTNIESQSNQDS